MTFFLGKASLFNSRLVHPDLTKVGSHACNISTQDFGVHETGGGRTAAEQHALFLKGVTQKDGYNRKSNHQVGSDGFSHGVDYVPWVDGKFVWDNTWKLHWPIAIAMGQASRDLGIKIRWGGCWWKTMDEYEPTVAGVQGAVEWYKKAHPGPDLLDAPHFELAI